MGHYGGRGIAPSGGAWLRYQKRHWARCLSLGGRPVPGTGATALGSAVCWLLVLRKLHAQSCLSQGAASVIGQLARAQCPDGGTRQGIREVRAVKVKYSKSQLDSWFRTLSDDLGAWEFPELTGMGVSIGEDHASVVRRLSDVGLFKGDILGLVGESGCGKGTFPKPSGRGRRAGSDLRSGTVDKGSRNQVTMGW